MAGRNPKSQSYGPSTVGGPWEAFSSRLGPKMGIRVKFDPYSSSFICKRYLLGLLVPWCRAGRFFVHTRRSATFVRKSGCLAPACRNFRSVCAVIATMMMHQACAIETSDVTRRFGARTVLHQLSLRVPESGIYGFLGLNGAGKTTTIRLLLGLIKADAGSINVFGKPFSHDLLRRDQFLS